MNYKDALLFVARSLTISTNEKNKIWVENLLKSNLVCWDKVVRQSTKHYVLPALYSNLKKKCLLHFLPEELVVFMTQITNLNRVRNEKIFKQAKELNRLLLKNSITPIFIKGSGFILQELYDDISERMIGDIDFIVPKKDALKAYIVLVNNGYYKQDENSKKNLSNFRHLPRLIKKDRIAAVEIHHELTLNRYRKEFSYSSVSRDIITTSNNLNFLNYQNQVSLTIIATQINNVESVYIKKIQLRSTYDIYLLSKKTNTFDAIKHFKKLYRPLNNYLAISQYVFNDETITAKSAARNIKSFNKNFFATKNVKIKKKILLFKLSFIDADLRKTLLKRIGRKSWRTQKLIEIGLKRKLIVF